MTEHHLVNMSRHLANMIGAPVKALFIEGPQEIRKMYTYEVREREKSEKRHRLFRKLYALMSAAGGRNEKAGRRRHNERDLCG